MRRWWLAATLVLTVLALGLGWYAGTRYFRQSTEKPQVAEPAPAPAEPTPAPAKPAPAPAEPTPPPPDGNTGGGKPTCTPGQAADYFPYHLGTQAVFAGLGNEYAAFNLKVIAESGGKVEWRKDNGGTTMAQVHQVAPQQITLIYREPEAYDSTPRINNTPNQSEMILKGPIQVGTQWTSGNTAYQITDTNASVQALGNQTLTCVVLVELTTPNSQLLRNYYHKQYGLVLSVFDPSGNPIESRLSSFTP